MNILLISILQNSHRNLSILSLYAFLNKHGVDTKVLFLPIKKAYDSKLLKDFISKNRFQLIGISLMTDGFDFATQLTKDIKACMPETFVMWGGIHPTLMPEECLGIADGICIGEGENTLLSIVQRLATGENLSNVPGFGLLTPDGNRVVNPPTPRIADLDTLPAVTYAWDEFFIQDNLGLRYFDVKEYARYSNYNGEDYTLMASRSCPFSCSYCCNSFLNKLYHNQERIRKRSVDNVISELKAAIKNIGTIQFVNFIDDQFLTTPEWTEQFITKYEKEIGLPFIVRLVPETVDDDTIKKLKRIGLRFVQIGIQSGSETTNKDIFHRRFNKDKLIQTSKIFSDNGVVPIYDVIIQNDFESDSDRNKTIQLLLQLYKPFMLTLFRLTPYPGTELVEIYKKKQLQPTTNPYGKGYSDYDEQDFYYQLCSIIPYTPHLLTTQFFNHRNSSWCRFALKKYYSLTKNIREHKKTAQDLKGKR